MRIAKNDIPIKIRRAPGRWRAEDRLRRRRRLRQDRRRVFSLGAGPDIAPLLKGLKGDLCQAPHWGYLIQGEVAVTYADDREEVISGGDLFYWPPGHTVKVGKDAEVVLFSPQHEHTEVLDHMLDKMRG